VAEKARRSYWTQARVVVDGALLVAANLAYLGAVLALWAVSPAWLRENAKRADEAARRKGLEVE
jgi:hypothetical protein